MEAGEKAAVTPVGNPVTDNACALLNPFWAAVVTVSCALLPCVTLKVFALLLNVKVGALMISDNVAVVDRLPLVPLMVSV